MERVQGNLVDIYRDEIYPAEIVIENGSILSIKEIDNVVSNFILPGFVDAHVHIESSMVTPVEFSRTAVRHGSIAAISDPHEIGNVLGIEGVKFMLENAAQTPFKFLFGAPSCVPATAFESSGAVIDSDAVKEILELENIGFLSEMMNYPGVINDDIEVYRKISIAKSMGLPIDGHAPGLLGEDLKKYAGAGISTDHECFTYEEAIEKIKLGMKILIREGSGAKNFEALIPLLKEFPREVMFCSDDLHPDDLVMGHINILVKRAVDSGYNLFDAIRAGGFHAREHYKLPMGMLKEAEPADFVIIDSLKNWKVLKTYINGGVVYENKSSYISRVNSHSPNKFRVGKIDNGDIAIEARGKEINVIEAIDGELITKKLVHKAFVKDGMLCPDINNDILKIVVINRYMEAKPAVGFIKGFNLKKGAIASSIGHDSHNIICIGTSDSEIVKTVNWIIENTGGIAIGTDESVKGLALEIAGIMSILTVEEVAEKYSWLTKISKELGCEMKAPYMTLAFMALLVIPALKMSDKGLFDSNTFSLTSIFANE